MRKLVIGMAMASTAIASPALARDGSWYVELQGGPMIIEDMDFDVNNGADRVTADTKEGYDFGGVVGYDFGFVRLEADGSYRAGDIDNLLVGSTGVAGTSRRNFPSGFAPARGEVNVLSFMLNALADFGDDDGLQGFVGGGVGVARTDVESTVQLSGPGAFDDSDTGFAWQLLAGVRAPLTDRIDVGLRYRMFTAEDVGIIDTLGRDFEGKFRSHSILGTFTYNFGAPVVAPPPVFTPPPPPPVMAPPPPPMMAPCNRGPYIVFFEFDKSDVTPEAGTVLDNAVSAYANCGSAAVMLAGHTDRSGSVAYNMGLAERRNASVRSYLTGRGIPNTRISSEGFGESRPRVPTADGVRELQNRRVEITYGPGSGM